MDIPPRSLCSLPPGGLVSRSGRPFPTDMRYKIEVQDDTGVWTDVRGPGGAVLVFDDEAAARAALAEQFPVLVQMEKYAGGKRTRVIRILEDEDDWPVKGPRSK